MSGVTIPRPRWRIGCLYRRLILRTAPAFLMSAFWGLSRYPAARAGMKGQFARPGGV